MATVLCGAAAADELVLRGDGVKSDEKFTESCEMCLILASDQIEICAA